jgi:membrane-associated phospholipid phosphatase
MRAAPAMPPRVRTALALFCAAVFALLALQVVLHGPMLEVDQDVSHWFSVHRNASLTQAMLVVSSVHQTGKLLAVSVVLALGLAVRGGLAAARALLVVPLGMLLNLALKDAFQRARPVLEDPLVRIATYSFPSGHAVASTVFYGALCALVFTHTRSRVARTAACALALVMVPLVCFSRVYLGAHFPSDVLAGVAVGTLCLTLLLRPWRRPARPGPGLPSR